MIAKDKAIELICDYSEMQCTTSNLSISYREAKLFAKYAANTAKWSHEKESDNWLYWEEVKQEIDKL